MYSFESYVPGLLFTAALLPLAAFVVILICGNRLGRRGIGAGYVATGAILASSILSFTAATIWVAAHATPETHAADGAASHAVGSPHGQHAPPPVLTGHGYTLAKFFDSEIAINYYIDALTILMFCLITLIATCIHFYATGYLHDELQEVIDREVVLRDGEFLRRPGRYPRFFQTLSLFCFSMLGLVLSGNLLMTFVFWELVGICSYLLIGFYVERPAAVMAAGKAFIVNRVGDFGMLVGLMVLWASLGTFNFGDIPSNDPHSANQVKPGLFSQVRTEANDYRLVVPDAMVQLAARQRVAEMALAADPPLTREALTTKVQEATPAWRDGQVPGDSTRYGHTLLMVAGLGIFCGCVGKSAQVPLHTWLPDAMEGPTPVSALVHSATMVAAGVFLVARFYPVLVPEVLLVIACVGSLTLLLGASLALVATDIKRVLAYSTISQLGYMMLALGVGGWLAGVMHLVTHALFKSLLFLGSGSVIHAVGTNEMPLMGGLRRKMPYTAYTMLVGCLAIAGVGIPSVLGLPLGLSGYYSKDAILEQIYSFRNFNPMWGSIFFGIAAGGAALTAFYMFRLWYLTFSGTPRSAERYAHAHESPRTMVVPLVILAVLAVIVAWPAFGWIGLPTLTQLIEQARPAGIWYDMEATVGRLVLPEESKGHAVDVKNTVGLIAFATALGGIGLATVFYLWKNLDPAEVRRMFTPVYRVLARKWYFDEIYHAVFVRGTLAAGVLVAWFDRQVIDRLVNGIAWIGVGVAAAFERWVDRRGIDGLVNGLSSRTYALGHRLRRVQTGNLRQYVMLVAVSTVALFLMFSLWTFSLAR